MPDYLNWSFSDTPSAVSTFDELPLWSAPFGHLMLQHVPLKRGITMLDIGSGAGFPLFEIAQRLGPSAKCFGIDTWKNANERAKLKIVNYGVSNVQVLEGDACQLPFDNNCIDLIVSNLGINNFIDPAKVLRECSRVLNPKGTIAITTNLNGHFREFYSIFESTLIQAGLHSVIQGLLDHESHRGTVSTIAGMFTQNGLTVTRHIEESFIMRFLDGTAFLNHYFIRLGWLDSWKDLIPAENKESFFTLLEENLNIYAQQNNGLNMTVPMAYIEGHGNS